MKPIAASLAGFAVAMSAAASTADAQTLGQFRWQLQPYCNVVTVTVTQTGGVYTLDGFDDQCGAGQRAPLVGVATPNPDGTIGLGLQIVTVPGGRTVAVDARITLGSLGGPWSDSAGATGTLVFNGAAAGSPRPQPTSTPSWGAIVDGPATGTAPGLQVRNPDTSSSAAPAIVGQVGPAPTLSTAGAAGVLGQSRDQVGVVGVSDVAVGVLGVSGNGYGVIGTSMGGIGVVASSLGSSPALLVANGAIGVAGTTRSAFQHVATAGNISGNLTRIDHPLLNNDPNAMVFFSHVYLAGASAVYVAAPTGVYYEPGIGRWSLYREDLGTMPVNARFNILVIKQ